MNVLLSELWNQKDLVAYGDLSHLVDLEGLLRTRVREALLEFAEAWNLDWRLGMLGEQHEAMNAGGPGGGGGGPGGAAGGGAGPGGKRKEAAKMKDREGDAAVAAEKTPKSSSTKGEGCSNLQWRPGGGPRVVHPAVLPPNGNGTPSAAAPKTKSNSSTDHPELGVVVTPLLKGLLGTTVGQAKVLKVKPLPDFDATSWMLYAQPEDIATIQAEAERVKQLTSANGVIPPFAAEARGRHVELGGGSAASRTAAL